MRNRTVCRSEFLDVSKVANIVQNPDRFWQAVTLFVTDVLKLRMISERHAASANADRKMFVVTSDTRSIVFHQFSGFW